MLADLAAIVLPALVLSPVVILAAVYAYQAIAGR